MAYIDIDMAYIVMAKKSFIVYADSDAAKQESIADILVLDTHQ